MSELATFLIGVVCGFIVALGVTTCRHEPIDHAQRMDGDL